MEVKIQTLSPNYTKLSNFRSPTPKILYGKVLKEIQEIQRSILCFGLLNPLVVKKNRNRLVVIDGRKRLAAIRRLRFEGKLPRSLTRIPYVMVDQTRKSTPDFSLMSQTELYEQVKALKSKSQTITQIASLLHTSQDNVRVILNVDDLSPLLKNAFLDGALTLAQVKAFSTIPNTGAQNDLLIKLGPFANETDILSSIADGETVLTLGDDNVIILPSRRKPKLARKIAA